MNIPQVRAGLFHIDGWTDLMKLTVALLSLLTTSKTQLKISFFKCAVACESRKIKSKLKVIPPPKYNIFISTEM